MLYVALVLAAVTGFVSIWQGVCRLIAILGGWRKLASRYECRDAAPDGRPTRLATAWLGAARYKNCIYVAASPSGLRLSVMALFRPGHPPLLVPWSDIEVASQPAAGRGFTTLELGRPALARLQLPAGAYAAIEQALRSLVDAGAAT